MNQGTLGMFRPYHHLLKTPDGNQALYLVCGTALGVAMNEASPGDLHNAIELAEEISGIPASAFARHAESVVASFLGHKATDNLATEGEQPGQEINHD